MVVSEGVLTTPVQVSASTLLRDAVVSAVATTTPPTATSGSDDAADWWDHELAFVVGAGVIGCLLLAILTVYCYRLRRGDRFDRLDKMLVRPNVQPGPSPLPFQPRMAGPDGYSYPGGPQPGMMAAAHYHPSQPDMSMMQPRPGSPGFGGPMAYSNPGLGGTQGVPRPMPVPQMVQQQQMVPPPGTDPNAPPRMAPLDQSTGGLGMTSLNASFDSSAVVMPGPHPGAQAFGEPHGVAHEEVGRLPSIMVTSEMGVVMGADALNAHAVDNMLWQRNSVTSLDEAIADDVDVSGMPANVAVAIVKARRASVRAGKVRM